MPLGGLRVEAQRPLAGTREPAPGRCDQREGQLLVTGRTGEVERRGEVMSEDLGEVLGALADLGFEPVGGGGVLFGAYARAAAC